MPRRLGHGPSLRLADVGASLTAKSGAVFAVSSPDGDIDLDRNAGHGLYFDDTRYLDRDVLRIDGQPLGVLLAQSRGASTVSELANADIQLRSAGRLAKDRISVRRERRLGVDAEEVITLKNFAGRSLSFDLSLEYGSTFDDIFTVRGAKPGKRGRVQTPRFQDRHLDLGYDGADGYRRAVRISFSPPPDRTHRATAVFRMTLSPGDKRVIRVRIDLKDAGRRAAKSRPMRKSPTKPLAGVSVETDNELFNACLERSFADLQMLVMSERGKRFFAAGVPWYVALFGRDSLITSLESMAFGTEVAAETLRLLARYQATDVDVARDAQPGKVLHELRVGERANLQEPPPTPYYGTVDATPLFLVVLAEYVRWTGDLGLFHELRRNVDAALGWLERWADSDGDGLVDYHARTRAGFRNQGWKDSDNSVVNADGSLAEPPIALIEVQGYVYRALIDVAWLLRLAGEASRADQLELRANELKRLVRERYWSNRLDYPAMAIQRGGQRAEAVASNAGQALWAGVLDGDHERKVAGRLLDPTMFSGWGVRTLAADERAYNPIDYQVGAVWPHDTALIMAGLKRTGRTRTANQIFAAMLDAAARFGRYRLPELFAGYGRDEYSVPVRYPVACSPQAWSAGALPYMVTAAAGLQADAVAKRLTIKDPELPPGVRTMTLRGIRVADSTIDIQFMRKRHRTAASVLRLVGDLDVQLA
ncbi:MAG TPA: glycogen debranching N-terminal domain-containing protein [Candidatus Dormibacteraeota bacterium]|nr:glycogen debranching N-terminal domain-containing protein [Candidatus Dormibacteraeota bacterium]